MKTRRTNTRPNIFNRSIDGAEIANLPNHRLRKTTERPYRCYKCTNQPSLLVQMFIPISLALVFTGLALLVSDRFQVFALLILNNALGTILNFMKFRLTPRSTLKSAAESKSQEVNKVGQAGSQQH
jgi:hypothetical protein